MTGTTADPFARQRLIGGWRQERLATATAIVLGVGALGNEVAKNLALAGVGRLIVCDPDVVETSNLSRCVLFTAEDVGAAKADAAARTLTRLGPDTVVEPRTATLTRGVGLGELDDAQVVLGCLDSRRARLELLGRCALVNAPLVDGGTGPWSGEVRVRTSPDRGCFSCTLTAYERGESDTPRSCAETHPPGEEPASIATTALVASWMTVAALRVVFGFDIGYDLVRIEALTGSSTPVMIHRDPGCLYHESLPPVDQRLTLGASDDVRTLLDAVPDATDVQTWSPFAILTRCLRCGTQTGYDPKHSVGGLLHCVQCGAVVRPHTSQNLLEAGESLRLEALGVAPQEILRVRGAEGGHRWVRLGG